MKRMMVLRNFPAMVGFAAWTMLAACGGNTENPSADAVKGTDTTAAATTETPGESATGNTATCYIKAKMNGREWTSAYADVDVARIKEHLSIEYKGNGDGKDIHDLTFKVNGFKGPGTYTFAADGEVTFIIGLEEKKAYVTAAKGSHGSITVEEFSKDGFKATFKFRGGNMDTSNDFLDVTEGVIYVKSSKDGCEVKDFSEKPAQ